MHTYQPGRLVVASLRAEDVPAAAHFYRDVIGLRLMPDHGQWPAFGLENGVHLVIVQGQIPASRDEGAARFPVIALSVPDLDEAVEHLQAHGVELPWGVESNRGARWVMFYDPAGNLIELAQLS
jgi:catechol 2,3-dioxygenase-like lactoylglutathione lyase family enzyme